MTLAIKSFTGVGSELHDLSLKTGVSVKALAGLKYAAEQNGASLGTVEMAIRRTASAMQDAKDGLAETKRGFDRMGLSLTELEGLNPEEQFMKIAGAIAEIPDPMMRAATAQDLFGRSGTDMLPMLSEGADGLRKMMEEGVKLTGWTDEGTKSADALGDAFGTLKTSTMGVFNAIGSALAPILKELTDKIVGVIKSISDWAKKHPELVKQIGLLALAVGGFLTVAGTLMVLAPAIAAAWAVAMGPVGGVIVALTALIAVGVLLWQNWDKTGKKIKELTATIKTELEKQKADAIQNYTNLKAIAQSAYETAINNIRKEYGVFETVEKNKMSLLKEEYALKVKTLDAESDYQISTIQAQIDAIDKQTSQEDIILTKQAEQNRLIELQKAADSATTLDDITRTHKDLAEYQTEITRNELLRQRDAEKNALYARITDIRTRAQTEKDALDISLIEELKRLDDERIAKEAMEKAKLDATLSTLTNEETAIKASFDSRLTEASLYQSALELTLKDINQTVTTTYVSNYVSSGGDGGEVTAPTIAGETYTERYERLYGVSPGAWEGFQHGGIVTQPTMAMIGEAGPEAVIPLNEAGGMGGITINFTQPVFFDREDSMNRFVDLIRKSIQRQDRLRFGGAYAGG